MDYEAFFNEVAVWINECNGKAVEHGIQSNEFWDWVMRSLGDLSVKYGNNELVQRQTFMLVDWLNDIYEKGKVI